jgi:formylmethanofuran dehydrogenase subunit B
MPVMSTVTEQKPNKSVVEDATCTFCGCLCDDIALSCDANRITGARNACALGESWFLDQGGEAAPACLIEGKPASVSDGIERAAHILNDARYPIVLGLDLTTTEAQRVAVAIGDKIGACVDPAHSGAQGPATLALQEVGKVTCTLGEVKNRGDLIIFWGCDPVETHPRHLSRYSLEAPGTFVPRGREDRYCVVVDVRETATAKVADQFLAVKASKDFEALWILRALAKGVELDADVVETETNVALPSWQELMHRMKRARYGVIFFDPGRTTTFDRHQSFHALYSLVRDMNAHARFVCMSMGGRGNPAGADNVMTWQTGYPFAVNFARGYPRFGPGEYTSDDVLSRGEADAALIVAGDPVSDSGPTAQGKLTQIPTVVLDSRTTATTAMATVAFRTATCGIGAPGTVYRVDGVPLPLRTALESPLASDVEVLKRIECRLRELRSNTKS